MNTTYAGSGTLENGTLIQTWLAPLDTVRRIALVVAFSLLTALSAQIVIPLPLVPITGQTFAVLLTGALLGSRLGALAMVAYLAEGAIGLPFFRQGNGGWQYLFFSPTAGYLFAYPIAAFVTGYLAERGWDKTYLKAAAAMAIGSFVILFCGWAWLARLMPPLAAWHVGVERFLIGDAVKIALAAAVLPSGWALIKNFKR